MNILYASNDGYARHLGTSMCSVFENCKKAAAIHVYILSLGLSGTNRERLLALGERYGRNVTILELGDLREKIGFSVDTGGYDISILGRLFLGELLPESVERILYLDCDTVVLRPLGALWRHDLSGAVLGAVQEPTIYPVVKASIGLSEDQPYYNSGVLLVDVAKWRAEGVGPALLDFLRKKGGKLFASDQDVLNGVLAGRISDISPRYNFFPNYRYFSYETLVRHSAPYAAVGKAEFLQAKRHPVLIHYMGDERPWIRGNRNHYRRAYEMYLKKTPWAGTPKETGRELYMLAYHALDYVTAVCPAVRWKISEKLGMKFVENRKKR